jgi:GT2 family glycosyltransferase
MPNPQITVAIVSWLREERLIKTLESIPKTTSLPLNLCLHVQGEEKVTSAMKQRIIDSASGFVEKDIYFSSGNGGIAPPRAANLKRAAKTPYIFMSDNDMDYQPGTIDAELEFLESHPDYGMVDVIHNQLVYHRTVKGTEITCISVSTVSSPYIDVDLIGGTSQLIRQEVALIPNIIDIRYFIGSWDFDFSMNVRKAGWKIATLTDRRLTAYNDRGNRKSNYGQTKENKELIQRGRKLFESKWGFSCVWFPHKRIEVKPPIRTDTTVVSRAIYNEIGPTHGLGIIDEQHLTMLQNNFINSLKAQTDQEFKICLAVGPENCKATRLIKSLDWGNLNVQFLYTSGDLSQWKSSVESSKNWAKETDKGSPEYITRHLDYVRTPIMARLDIDDWVAPGWIAHMKSMANLIDEDRFLINYQVFGQAPDGRVYKFYAQHNRSRTSPFMAIVQKKEITTDIYETVHLRMGNLFDSVYTIPPSYAFMVVHGSNRSNQVYELDTFSYIRESKHEENKVQINKRIIKPRSWRGKLAMTQRSLYNQTI